MKLITKLKNGLYVLRGTGVPNEESKVWHGRLGPISNNGLNHLYKQGLIGKPSNLSFCEHCILGKSTKHNFQKGSYKSSDILEYVHSDLWGPLIVQTHRGARYFLTIIDDYSRKL